MKCATVLLWPAYVTYKYFPPLLECNNHLRCVAVEILISWPYRFKNYRRKSKVGNVIYLNFMSERKAVAPAATNQYSPGKCSPLYPALL